MCADKMNTKQFNEFWEIKCPHCNEMINVEILASTLGIEKSPMKALKK